MPKKTTLLWGLFLLYNISYCQHSNPTKTDTLIQFALTMAEESLYAAKFEHALALINGKYFQELPGYNDQHKIQLQLQRIRIEGFRSIVYRLPATSTENFKVLQSLAPTASNLNNKEAKAHFYLNYASAHRSLGNIDSSSVYENKAIILLEEIQNQSKLAEIRANKIARQHNQLLRADKRDKILELIPEYQKEIEYSQQHSRYALAYNTRHLAQIHRRQTLNYPEALRLFKASLDARKAINFLPFLPASYSSIGDVHMKMTAYKAAIEAYSSAAKLANDIGFVRYQSYPLLMIGDCHLELNDTKSALSFYLKALKIAAANKYEQDIVQAEAKIKAILSN